MTNAELAVLSLIVEQARYGYEIETLIEQRGMREWTEIGFSSIYYLLKKLEKAGYIGSRLEAAAKGPARKVYHATEAGIEQLRTAVWDALSTPQASYPLFQMGLANLPILQTHEIIAAIQGHITALAAEIERLAAAKSTQLQAPYFVQAMFDYSMAILQAQVAWMNAFIAQLEQDKSQ